jgi:putative tricarboxylic transport membrane protein
MILLVSIYVGGISGGLVSATLLRMPGTPSSMMTTFDAYPMASQGQPGKALGLGVSASFFGGFFSWIFLVSLARPMSIIAVKFSPFEYFSLVFMALILIVLISKGSMVKGLLSGLLGILATMPGVDTCSGFIRLTFGLHELEGGFGLLPVLIGIFAFNQLMVEALKIRNQPTKIVAGDTKGIFLSSKEWKENFVNLLRSSLIGTWIGILPGVGANLGSMISYTTAKSASKAPEKFGKGSPEGIIASEAGNNATIGGALIPLLALGIPGSIVDAILIGALILHGMQPGPLLFVNNPDVAYAIITTALVANCVMFLLMSGLIKYIAKISLVKKSFLIPAVFAFCVTGTFSLANRIFDVITMVVFGIIGFLFERADVPLQPFVIGFVLAPIAEEYLRSGLMISRGSFLPFLTRPISALCLFIALALLVAPYIKGLIQKKNEERNKT